MLQKQLLRMPRVREIVALSRSEIYRLMSLNKFPHSVPLGERVRAWDAEEVQDWVAARIAARNMPTHQHNRRVPA